MLPTISRQFHTTFTLVTSILGVPTNIILLIVILRTPNASIGMYRYLLAAFAVFDFLTIGLQSFLLPSSFMFDAGFVLFGYGVLSLPTWMGNLAMISFMVVFYDIFVLLAFHFVYRYIVVCKPNLAKYTAAFWIKLALCINLLFVLTAVSVFVTVLPDDATRHFLARQLKSSLGINVEADNKPALMVWCYRRASETSTWEWVVKGVGPSLVCSSFLLASGVVIAFCSIQILRYMKMQKGSSRTRILQRQLFHALLAQTFVPLFLSYAPPIVHLFLPFSGRAFGSLGDFFLISTTLYPVLDPLIILFFVKPYRTACVDAVTRLCCPSIYAAKMRDRRASILSFGSTVSPFPPHSHHESHLSR